MIDDDDRPCTAYVPLSELNRMEVLERLIYLEDHTDAFVCAQTISWAKCVQENNTGMYIPVWMTIAVNLAHRLERKG